MRNETKFFKSILLICPLYTYSMYVCVYKYFNIWKWSLKLLEYKTEKLLMCWETIFPASFHGIFRCIM
jgi:hypothetical protein